MGGWWFDAGRLLFAATRGKLVLGNWAKTLHPRNVGFAEFMNKFVSHLRGGKLYLARRKHS
jgi:hypothetical protein